MRGWGEAAGLARTSVMRAEVVMTEAAMEAELSTACCVTVAGSITPDSSRFSYVPVAAFQPKPKP